MVVLDQLDRLGGGDGVIGRAVLEAELEWRPSRPPLALMSLTTILATLALATPTTASGPVWSVMTPTLMGPCDAAITFLLG